MKKMSRFLAAILLVSIVIVGCAKPSVEKPPVETPSVETPAVDTPAVETPAVETPSSSSDTEVDPLEDPNKGDYSYIVEAGTKSNINDYYAKYGVEAIVDIRGMGGAVNIPDVMTTEIPTANKKYKIGFSIYYTVDEVGAMILETVKSDAEKAGIELLVNDANYDQNAQNQAVEQWILEGVDGVIICPCDFTGVKPALDALEAANIPVVTINAPLAGNVDSIIMSECTEQGKLAAEALEAKLLADGTEMKGVVIIQTLPFVHPNAATRIDGFKKVFEKYSDIELIELTGISPEEHYAAFEGAMLAHQDILGAFGLYASATIGMNNAKKAAKKDIPLTSIDNDKLILAGVYNGEILGSACYSSTTPAHWAITGMVNKLNGIEIPGVYYYPNTMVTKDNVEEMFSFYYAGKKLQDYLKGEQ